MPIFVDTSGNRIAQKRMNLTRADKRWIDEFCGQLSRQFPGLVDQVLIYGSKARGEAGPDSDLDLLLIVRDDATKKKRQMREIGYLLAAEGDVLPSIMAYTVKEWEQLKTCGSRFREAVERDEVRVL
jgi:predicted nucleotidyltransferase